MGSKTILSELKQFRFANTFNPYFQTCPNYDRKESPKLRRNNLTALLERAAAADLEALWVGRDLGHRGGRRTGLALTDDVHFASHLSRWGLESKRPTLGEPVAEVTTAVVWEVLDQISSPVFLWNVFPIHPFDAANPFSNRKHNAAERKAGISLLTKVVDYLRPNRIIAIGKDAYSAISAEGFDVTVETVRHLSFGGQREFLANMRGLYKGKLQSR